MKNYQGAIGGSLDAAGENFISPPFPLSCCYVTILGAVSCLSLCSQYSWLFRGKLLTPALFSSSPFTWNTHGVELEQGQACLGEAKIRVCRGNSDYAELQTEKRLTYRRAQWQESWRRETERTHVGSITQEMLWAGVESATLCWRSVKLCLLSRMGRLKGGV